LKKYQNQERVADFGLDIDLFKFRPSDPTIGRFWQIDPLASDYVYNSPYALQENKFGLGVELEGKEIMPFPAFGLSVVETPLVRPMSPVRIMPEMVGRTIETMGKVGEVSTKASKFTPETKANFARGNKMEAEQLEKMGVEKNTKPFTVKDPKTGKEGTTVPDAITEKGGTIEVKYVKKQGFTEQLRLQKEVSNSQGENPILRINKDASLTKPLKNSGYDIQPYSNSPILNKLMQN
jgi:hypothetical protein